MFTSCLQRSTWKSSKFQASPASPEDAKFHFVRTDAVQLAITGPHPLVPPQTNTTNWTKNQCNPATMSFAVVCNLKKKQTKSVGNDVIEHICHDVDSEAPYVHHVQTTIWKNTSVKRRPTHPIFALTSSNHKNHNSRNFMLNLMEVFIKFDGIFFWWNNQSSELSALEPIAMRLQALGALG